MAHRWAVAGWLAMWLSACMGCGGAQEATAPRSISQDDSATASTRPIARVDAARVSPVRRPAGARIRPTAREKAGHLQMLGMLADLAERQAVENPFYGTGRVEALRRQLRGLSSPPEQWFVGFRLGLGELELGNEQASLDAMAKAKAIFDQVRKEIPQKLATEMYFLYGTAFLRHGETQNCCLLHNQDSCLLPIRGGGIHARQEGSRMAIEMFQEVLRTTPRGGQRYYESLWLLNIAYMTLGEHPQGVPPEYLIPWDRFLSPEPFPRFPNIASRLGLDTFDMAGSVVADDFNNDGYLDLLVGCWDLREQLRFYLNTGAGEFEDRTVAAGLEGMRGGLNMVQGDYNNDGWLDVYVLRGAWLHEQGRHPDSLLRNNGDGTFTDVTFDAGLADVSYPSQTAAWADYDLDGDLDLFVGGEGMKTEVAPCRLFRNNGDGTFTDVALAAGVSNGGFTKGVVWGDYNADRFPDIFVSNLGGPNRLYRNNGDGTFTDVAPQAGVSDFAGSFPAWFWDFDNDGILDLFVGAYDGVIEQVCRYYLGDGYEVGLSRIYRGSADGTFEDRAWELGLREPSLVMGANFGDLDNDGYLDVYLGTGDPHYWSLMPNKMYRNVRGQRFVDVSETGGFSSLQKGHGVSFADLDEDGDQDIVIQMGGAFPGDKYPNMLFENPGFGANWLAIELVGLESNRFGIGSRIHVEFDDQGQSRSVFRWVNSGGSFGGNPLRQHLGLGKASVVRRLEVYWPMTDRTQEFLNVPANRVVRITEGAADYHDVTPRAFTFSSAPL